MTSGDNGNSDRGRVFCISDNHFSDYDGPDDVIHKFRRPFPDSLSMNASMVERWNAAVRPEDTVFSLGDFSWNMADFQKYSVLLNGKKFFLLGNHDFEGEEGRGREARRRFPARGILTYREHQFLLVHRPEDIPVWWKGWGIHGHHHRREEYPFIEPGRKNICVACERVNYTPVALDDIITGIEAGQRIETAGD